MANENDSVAITSAKAMIHESLGMLKEGATTIKNHKKVLRNAEKTLTPAQIQSTIRKFESIVDVPEKAPKFKKKEVSGSDIRVPRKGRPVTPEAAEAARNRSDRGIRARRDIGGGRRLTGWKQAAEAELQNRIAAGEPVDIRPYERKVEHPERAEEVAAGEKERRERRKRIRKEQKEKGIFSKWNKGGVISKPKMAKGGSYKGKQHMYAAGGMVKELKI